MISETAASLGPSVKPGAVLVSVGGGGLLCGIIQGLKDVGWMDVPIVAMETVGADCFNAAIKAGRIITLDDITRLVFKACPVSKSLSFSLTDCTFLSPLPSNSEAKCLGAKTVCKKAFEYSQCSEVTIISELVTDQQALHAIEKFLGWKNIFDW